MSVALPAELTVYSEAIQQTVSPLIGAEVLEDATTAANRCLSAVCRSSTRRA